MSRFEYETRAYGKVTAAKEVDDQGQHTEFGWVYDDTGRLVQETYNAPGTQFDYIDKFRYDDAGNRTARHRNLGNSDEQLYSTDQHLARFDQYQRKFERLEYRYLY